MLLLFQGASGVQAAAPVKPVDPTFNSSWEAYEDESSALGAVLGSRNQGGQPIKHRVVSSMVDGSYTNAEGILACCAKV